MAPPKGYRKPKPQLASGSKPGNDDSAMAAAKMLKQERGLSPSLPSLPQRKRERKGQPQRAPESCSRPRSPLVKKVNRKPKNHFLAPVQDTKRVPKRNPSFGDYVVALPSRMTSEDKDGDSAKAAQGRRPGTNDDGIEGDDDDDGLETLEEGEEEGDHPGDEPEDYAGDSSASDDDITAKKQSGLAAMAAGATNGRKRKRPQINGVAAPPGPEQSRIGEQMWEDVLVLVEELILRGEVTDVEGSVLRRLAETHHGPLGKLFQDTTESRAHFVVGAKRIIPSYRA